MPLRDTRYVHGAERLGRRMATITAALSLPVLTREVGELLLKRTLIRFKEEVDPDNVPWKPLAATTMLRRRNIPGIGEAHPILVRSTRLRGAIRVLRGQAAGAVYTNTGAGVRIGVDDPDLVARARAHQQGNARVPQRRFLGIGRLDVKAVDSLLRRRGAKLNATLRSGL